MKHSKVPPAWWIKTRSWCWLKRLQHTTPVSSLYLPMSSTDCPTICGWPSSLDIQTYRNQTPAINKCLLRRQKSFFKPHAIMMCVQKRAKTLYKTFRRHIVRPAEPQSFGIRSRLARNSFSLDTFECWLAHARAWIIYLLTAALALGQQRWRKEPWWILGKEWGA